MSHSHCVFLRTSTIQSNIIKLWLSIFFAWHMHMVSGDQPVSAAEPVPVNTNDDVRYANEIQPLLEQFCRDCHSGDLTEADVDLGVFSSVGERRKHLKIWQRIGQMLESRQMPPKDAEQPNDVQRKKLQEWVNGFLMHEAQARAGDPGPVVLRRLSNAEYTYTIRDLTQIDSLDPAREFPIDGAAGEGFTNTGNALGMSPSLIRKYLDAGKQIADHAVLVPSGIRFSRYGSRRDWTDELVNRIQDIYRSLTGSGGGTSVNLQGIQFDTNQGGLLPVEKYLSATLKLREALANNDSCSVEHMAQEQSLSAKYLGMLWHALTTNSNPGDSLVMDRVRVAWQAASSENFQAVSDSIRTWQKALWKFNSIGHIGRAGGPKSWLEAVTPVVSEQTFQLDLPDTTPGQEVVIYMAAGSAGSQDDADIVVWKNPRLEAKNRPALPLRDVRGVTQRITDLRRESLQRISLYLNAAAESDQQTDVVKLATKNNLDPAVLRSWLNYLGRGPASPVEVTGHFTTNFTKDNGYDFLRGWRAGDLPSILGNASSDQTVNIPGTVRPQSVVAHPSPSSYVAVGWQSPITGIVQVDAHIADAHPGCGNGQQWVVQHRTSRLTGNLGQGQFGRAGIDSMSAKTVSVNAGELISLILGPRDGDHGCDLTELGLVITETAGAQRVWDLAKDLSVDIHVANPHDDRHGNTNIWHFYYGPVAATFEDLRQPFTVPAGSLLAKWKVEKNTDKRAEWVQQIQDLALNSRPKQINSPDSVLFEHLQALATTQAQHQLAEGVEPDPRFGKHPLGTEVDSANLIVQAPRIIEVRVPAELAAGRTFVVNGSLDSEHGIDGSVQLFVSTQKPQIDFTAEMPIVVVDRSCSHKKVLASCDAFRKLFPTALCYERIVPVDEAVTLTLFYREDKYLQQLMLEDSQIRELNQAWDELEYVSREPLRYIDAFEQIREFATQDRPDLVVAWKALIKPANDRADAFRQKLLNTEPTHVQSIIDFARRAWRRRLTSSDQQRLVETYHKLRARKIDHESAIRLTLARLLTAPAFLYRIETPVPGNQDGPVTREELANRLSYFLWSSLPDENLRLVAETGNLNSDNQLVAQTRRMLDDDRVRRLAIHFACQWLHIRDFDQNDEKNEKLYPEFATIRQDMYEESVLFFTDIFRNNGSVLDLFQANHTFLNEKLAKHYGIDGIEGDAWRQVGGVQQKGRGGVLGMGTVLASLSGASRTSPILRGNWVYETLLGERLPRPPANVPQLPETVPQGLTARELIEQHSSVAECAKCHARIDPYGFALEQYDAVGRLREQTVDTRTTLLGGKQIAGLDGLREYLVKDRREDILYQFCRKLLGYALGREVQLSDQPLLTDMQQALITNDYRFATAVEAIITSRQFREKRGRDAQAE